MSVFTTWWVNGVAMPSPMTMDWDILDENGPDDGRTLDGFMHVSIVAIKRKLYFKFPQRAMSVNATILQAIAPATFSVKYWDRLDNDWRTSTMYKGDRKTISFMLNEIRKEDKELTFNLIEC